MARAEAIGRAAQRRRLKDIAAGLRNRGVAVEIGTNAVVVRGRGLVRHWLADPLLRFLGRSGA